MCKSTESSEIRLQYLFDLILVVMSSKLSSNLGANGFVHEIKPTANNIKIALLIRASF